MSRMLLAVVLVLCAGVSGARAQYLVAATEPIRVRVAPQGELLVEDRSAGHCSGAMGSCLFLDGTKRSYCTEQGAQGGTEGGVPVDPVGAPVAFIPVTHHSPEGTVVETTLVGGDDVVVSQVVICSGATSEYTIRWEITNASERSFRDCRFIHGGTVYCGGPDGEDVTDGGRGMVVSRTGEVFEGAAGVLSLASENQSPANHFYVGTMRRNAALMNSGNLPDVVASGSVSPACSLQWDRSSLLPGETWTIQARGRWATAPVLRTEGPQRRSLDRWVVAAWSVAPAKF